MSTPADRPTGPPAHISRATIRQALDLLGLTHVQGIREVTLGIDHVLILTRVLDEHGHVVLDDQFRALNTSHCIPVTWDTYTSEGDQS